MAEVRALIADDEPLARRGIRQLLGAWPMVEVVGECRDGREAIRKLRDTRPDLLFLDVQMPGVDGMDVAQEWGGLVPAVVFITAHEHFAVKAFEARAVDYLVKPLSDARFRTMMARVLERLRALPRTRLAVPTDGGETMLDPREIDWIESEDDHAVIHAGAATYRVRQSLAALEEQLAPARFVRAHRTLLVRLDHVRELTDDNRVILRDGTTLPVSRRRVAQVRSQLHSPPATSRSPHDV
jgi:two-component system LytT family response regulator